MTDTNEKLSAAPAPEGGAVKDWDTIRSHPCYGEHQPGCDCSALATREEAPAEAGDIEDLAQRLCEIFCEADPRNGPGDGAAWPYLTLAEKAQWAAVAKAALRAQPQAREDAQPVGVSADDAKWLLDNYGPTSPRIERIATALLSTPPAPEAEKLRVALDDLRAWHTERHKALSKQPPSPDRDWRKAEHAEEIARIEAVLEQEGQA